MAVFSSTRTFGQRRLSAFLAVAAVFTVTLIVPRLLRSDGVTYSGLSRYGGRTVAGLTKGPTGDGLGLKDNSSTSTNVGLPEDWTPRTGKEEGHHEGLPVTRNEGVMEHRFRELPGTKKESVMEHRFRELPGTKNESVMEHRFRELPGTKKESVMEGHLRRLPRTSEEGIGGTPRTSKEGIPENYFQKTPLTASSKQRITRNHINRMSPNLMILKNGMAVSRHLSARRAAHVPSQDISFMGNYSNCSDRLCSQFLTAEDFERERLCLLRKRRAVDSMEHILDLNDPVMSKLWPGTCHFMDGRGRNPVMLTSFPGSGNTWVRGLLEQATGICTGSIYCDGGLRNGGLHGEGLTSGTVLVVKDHRRSWGDYQSAIVIIRNPLHALVSEYSRRVGRGHRSTVTSSRFMDNIKWDHFVRASLPNWQEHVSTFILRKPLPRSLLVVRYEDLQSDRLAQVKRLLEFLGVPYSSEKLAQRLSENYGTFQRKSPVFEHYTPVQKEHVLETINRTIHLLRRQHGHAYRMEEYLNVTD